MNQLIIPNTGVQLIDGSIVILGKYPDTKWIVHNGWYTYNEQQSMGWYFCSIPEKNIIPVNDDDLNSLTVVSGDGCFCPCPPHPFPPERTEIFTKRLKNELDAAFISVDTIADRDSFLDNDRKLPNGKVVKVNYVDDSIGPKYYRWDANNLVWKEEFFGIDIDNYVTKEQLESEVHDQIIDSDIPSQVEAAIRDDELIKQQVSSHVQELVPGEVEKSTVELKNDLQEVQEAIKAIHLDSTFDKTTGSISVDSGSSAILTGVAHDIAYDSTNLKIMIPQYGSDDIVINIPKDKFVTAGQYYEDYPVDNPTYHKVIVLKIDNQEDPVIIPAEALVNIYTVDNTNKDIVLTISDDNRISATVKIDPTSGNALKTSVNGLIVDISNKINKINDATGNKIVISNADGSVVESSKSADDFVSKVVGTPGNTVIFGEDGAILDSGVAASQPITLDAPSVVDYVVNEEAFIYPSGMINTKNIKCHDEITVDQFSMFNNKRIYGKEIITSILQTSSGQGQRNRFYLRKLSDNTDIETKDSVVNVWEVPSNPDTTKNVLIIGDSYTAEHKWFDYFKSDHFDSLSNYNFFGKINNILKIDDKAETTSNGVTYSISNNTLSFVDNGDEKTLRAQMVCNLSEPLSAGTYNVNFDFDITGTGFNIGVGFYNASNERVYAYTLFNYDRNITITLTDTVTYLNITAAPSAVFSNNISLYIEIPESNTSSFEATGGYTWNNYIDNPDNLPSKFNGNPFWIDGKIDIKKYVERRLGPDSNLDYLICMLGINTIVNNAYWTTMYNQDIDKAIDSINTFAPQLFEAVHAAYPNCKILVCGYPLPPFIDGVNNSRWNMLFTRAEFLHRLNQLYNDFANSYAYVRFVHVSSSVDSNKAFVLGDTVINNATYQMLTKDDIHPSDVGYHQIADSVWRGFVGLINM